MKAAIAELEIRLETLTNNEKINRAEGQTGQANLEAANAAEIRQAIAVLRVTETLADLAVSKITEAQLRSGYTFTASS